MEKVKLTDICRPKQWKTISTAQLKESGYPVYGANGKIGFYNEYTHEFPTLLITCRGATCGTVNISEPKSYVNGNAMALDNLSKDYDLKFLYHYFGQRGFNDVISGSAQPQITRENLSKVDVPKIDLATQQRIAAILDQADAIIQNNRAIVQKYDALTQSLFLDMFGDPVKNEKGWKVKSLGDITNLITDGKHGNCNDEKDSGYYFISAKDVKNNLINYTDAREIPKIEFEEVDKRTNLQPGDLVMINTGATIGRMAIAKDIPETRKTTFQKSVAVIKVKNDIISSFYLQYVLELGIKTFANMGSGSAIKNLLLSEMRRFKIILPNLELQNLFAERVVVIEAQKQQAQLALAKSEALFASLLQKAFKGEL